MIPCERCADEATWSDGRRVLCGMHAAWFAVHGHIHPIEAHVHPDTHHGEQRAS